MRIQLKWFLTGNVTRFEERDELLGPQTTVLEVKGLVQLRYTYPAKNMLLIHRKALCENDETLASLGVVDQAAADMPEHEFTVHVLSGAELEGEGSDEEGDEDAVDPATGSTIQEYTHDDFIKAMRMLGRELPVSAKRAAELRANPPRAHPAFLDAKPAGGGSSAAPAAAPAAAPSPPTADAGDDEGGMVTLGAMPRLPQQQPPQTAQHAAPGGGAGDGGGSEVRRILENVHYGLRREEAAKRYAVVYPGASELFDFWDLRLAMERHAVSPGEVAVELFYFGEIEKVDPRKFHAVVVDSMQRAGFRLRAVGTVREAGCMYPLIAVPVVAAEAEAMQLGDAVFEAWGKSPQERAAAAPPTRTTGATDGPAGAKKEECAVM